MAHRKVESPVTRAVRMIGYVNSKTHAENDFGNFSTCVVALRAMLYRDRPLDRVEFLFMENHMQILQMAYLRWKRKQVWSTDYSRPLPRINWVRVFRIDWCGAVP
jgi:hypothetical protein